MSSDQPAEPHGLQSVGVASVEPKLSCHSDYVDPDVARQLQEQRLVQVNTAPAHNVPTHDSVI